MAVVGERDRLIQAGNATAAISERTRVDVRETGVRVHVGNSIYAKTNHYIRASRPYFRNRTLREYWKCCNINPLLLFSLWLAVSMATSFIHWIVASMNVILDVLWICLFFQHMVVLCGTVPHILKQPILPDSEMRTSNSFMEIEVQHITGQYLILRNAGIGAIQREGGVIKFHILSEKAARYIRASRKCSIVGFLLSVLLLLFSCGVIAFDVSIRGGILCLAKANVTEHYYFACII